MDIITILTREYNYGADILEIQPDIPTGITEQRSISELILGPQANPFWRSGDNLTAIYIFKVASGRMPLGSVSNSQVHYERGVGGASFASFKSQQPA